MKNIGKKFFSSFFLAVFYAFPILTYAQGAGNTPLPSGGGNTPRPSGGGNTPSSGSSFTFQNPLSFDSLAEFIRKFLEVVIQIGFPLIVLAVIYTGFLFVKAQGKPEELTTAKTAFLWTVVGALLILGALAISTLIQGTVTEITR